MGIKKILLVAITLILGVVGVAFGMDPQQTGIDPDLIKKFLGEAASNQLAQAGFFFTAAAWVHSGQVKKEIKSSFSAMTDTINRVSDSLRSDIKEHSGKIDNISSRVQSIESNLNGTKWEKI